MSDPAAPQHDVQPGPDGPQEASIDASNTHSVPKTAFAMDNCGYMTLFTMAAGMGMGTLRVLQEARAQGLPATSVQNQIPRSSAIMGLRLGAFGASFCYMRRFAHRTFPKDSLPSPVAELVACAVAGAVSTSTATLGMQRGARFLASQLGMGAVLGCTIGITLLVARPLDEATRRRADE